MNTTASTLTENDLRKAWLKQKFLSFEYHEELLRDYDRWCQLFEQHWNSEVMRQRDPQRTETMVKDVIPRLREVSRPGTIPRDGWKDGNKSGWASTILYNINKGMQYLIDNPYEGMAGEIDKESDALNSRILFIATNIRRTSDDTWEKNSANVILDESNTGPVSWPSNWKDDLPSELVASAEKNESVWIEHVYAGKPCPRSGWWFTPAKANSRSHFKQGDVFPAIEGSAYGDTYWQWSPDQSSPSL